MIMIYAALELVGIATGLWAGLFGFGGGFVIVPAIYHLLPRVGLLTSATQHFAMHVGVATSTAVMIVTTAYATFKDYRAGSIDLKHVFPLGYYIALGAAAGAYVASAISGPALRLVFATYIAAVIVDGVLRTGSVGERSSIGVRPMSTPVEIFVLGVIIGAVASLLGVGGSVMTVPLMRRRGAHVRNAIALANPLSFPVAVVGTLTYVLAAAANSVRLGPGFLGFVCLPVFVVLSALSILGIEVAVRVLPKIPDEVHAIIYIGVLS